MGLKEDLESLLHEKGLLGRPQIGESVENSLLHDVRNVLADRACFLEQRNRYARYRDILMDLAICGLSVGSDDTVEEAHEKFLADRQGQQDAIDRGRVAEERLRDLRVAFRSLKRLLSEEP